VLHEWRGNPQGPVYIPYVKGTSEKFKSVGSRYSIKTILKAKHTFSSPLMETRPERFPQQVAQQVHGIHSDCGKICTGVTGRSLVMRLRNHRHNLINNNNNNNTVALVRERAIHSERPPLVGEVSGNFSGYRVSRGQRGGSLRP
jgi:hypothetical protein